MKFKKRSHALYYCDFHIVIATRYRRKWINEGIFAYLGLKLREITEHYPYLEFKIFNHDKDYVHMLASIPPTTSVGKVVGIFKQNTSKGIKQKFPFLKNVYWGTDSVWSDGYFVSTVGIDESTIRKYIENQGREDEGQTSASLFE
jgi:putative transposase